MPTQKFRGVSKELTKAGAIVVPTVPGGLGSDLLAAKPMRSEGLPSPEGIYAIKDRKE
jgi:hypothetical protein